MFAVLMYLFEAYTHSSQPMRLDDERLAPTLQQAGFDPNEIERALDWLATLSALHQEGVSIALTPTSTMAMRIYTSEEMQRLSTECRGFLLRIEQQQILNSTTREIVLQRLLELDKPELELNDIKWVIMMVLGNTPDNELERERMERLLLSENGLLLQ